MSIVSSSAPAAKPTADAAGAAEPVSAAEFASLLAPILRQSPTGLLAAVSGGPDSMALMGLLAGCRKAGLPPVTIASVDHGLRQGSDRETAFVADRAAALGLAAHRLAWAGPKPVRALQERARDARYALLGALCRRLGASHLLTAHTLDDQAETILFRLARGSGVAGLAGMAPMVHREGLVHARPLLGIEKARLVATCEIEGWPFLVDPSNADPRFARARMRKLMPALAAEGLDPARWAALARRAARVEAALEAATTMAAHEAERAAEAPGTVALDARTLAALPDELAIRVLGRAIARVGEGAIRLERLETCWMRLSSALREAKQARLTLAGALLALDRGGRLTLSRESPRRRGRAGHSG